MLGLATGITAELAENATKAKIESTLVLFKHKNDVGLIDLTHLPQQDLKNVEIQFLVVFR